jgi:hypothetical protein
MTDHSDPSSLVHTKQRTEDLLGYALSSARTRSVLAYARAAKLPTATRDDVEAARRAFFALPYAEQREYHSRPRQRDVTTGSVVLRALPDNTKATHAAVSAYRASGDADFAMRQLGIKLDDRPVERKRNARGIVEVLNSELTTPASAHGEESLGGELLDVYSSDARQQGLYEALGWDCLPSGPDGEAPPADETDALSVARAAVLPRDWGIFRRVELQRVPVARVAQQHGMTEAHVRSVVSAAKQRIETALQSWRDGI